MQLKFILRIALIGSIFLSSKGILYSCSCAGEAYFCQELNDTTDSYFQPDFVIKAIKLQDTLHGMFVKVEKNYINVIEAETILIWGDPGHLCRVYASNFEIGDTIILGIKQIDGPTGMPQESIGDYWLPACGVTFLRIENNIVKGPISIGTDEMFLEDFEFYMENEVYETECISTNLVHQNPFNNNLINLYPNPSRDVAFISCENCEIIDDLTIYNTTGQLKNIRFVKADKLIELDLGSLAKGIYFVKLRSQDLFKTYKFLVL